MVRQLTSLRFRHSFDIALRGMWGASALGHAWLAVSHWSSLSVVQVLMLAVAVATSSALLWWTPVLSRRPTRLLVVLLLVGLVHTPGEVLANPATPWVAAAVGALVLAVSGEAAERPSIPIRRFTFLPSLPTSDPHSRRIAFDLLCRPPPTR